LVADDFTAIVDLKMDHIRIHWLWRFFQPGISYVSSIAVKRLVEMLDLADAGLDSVNRTVLNRRKVRAQTSWARHLANLRFAS